MIESVEDILEENKDALKWLQDKRPQIEKYQAKVNVAKTIGTVAKTAGMGLALFDGGMTLAVVGGVSYLAGGITNVITDNVDLNCTQDHVRLKNTFKNKYDFFCRLKSTFI